MVGALLIVGILGFSSGIILFPLGLWVFLVIKNAKQRRHIKKLMRQGKILIPLDSKDYDVQAWQNKKYGNIDPTINRTDLENLQLKIFKKPILKEEKEITKEFLAKAYAYLSQVKAMGYDDEFIRNEFRKRNYTDGMIKEIFAYGTR